MRKATVNDFAEMLNYVDKPKGFRLVATLMADRGFSITTEAVRSGWARFGNFLSTTFSSNSVASEATLKLAENAEAVLDLIAVLKLTVKLPGCHAHEVVQKKLRSHTFDELRSEIKIGEKGTSVCDELVMAAADKATTHDQVSQLVNYTEPKSNTRAAVLAKAASFELAGV